MNGKWFPKLLGWLIHFLVRFLIISLFYLNEKIATDNPSAPTVENGEIIPNNNADNDPKDDSDDSSKDTDKESDKTYWGVDSASLTDKNMYRCVKDSFEIGRASCRRI